MEQIDAYIYQAGEGNPAILEYCISIDSNQQVHIEEKAQRFDMGLKEAFEKQEAMNGIPQS